MIGVIAILAAQATTAAPRYDLCSASGATVAELRQHVQKSRKFKDMPDSGSWHSRWNEVDTVWLFPDTGSGPDLAICRHLVADANGTSMQTQMICDGTDQACDMARDRLLGRPVH